MSEASELTWGDVERVPGGSGRVRIMGAEETSHREVSADTMRLLLPIRQGAGEDEPVLGMRAEPDSGTYRGGGETGGPRRGLFGGQPRLGMIKDMETVGVHLLGGYTVESSR